MNVAPVPTNTILPESNPIPSTSASATSTAAANASDPIDTQGMFMQLLTAQAREPEPARSG